MKKNLFPLLFFSLLIFSCTANEHAANILNSTNISETEEYISKAHPEDPKKKILKQRVIALKNAEWTKGRKDAKPMAARPIILEMPSKSAFRKNPAESEALFKKLLAETPERHKEKTTKLLNAIFNQDINSNEAILLLKNNSDCNMILEISGKRFYNLAVPAKSENSIVLEKDNYTLSGSLCDVSYKSEKNFNKSIVIILGNPENVINKEVTKDINPIVNDKKKTTKKVLPKKKNK